MPASRAALTSARTCSSVLFRIRMSPSTTLETVSSVPGMAKVLMAPRYRALGPI